MSDVRQPRRVRVPVEALGERAWERVERRLEAARDEDRLRAPVVDLRAGARRLALVTMLAAGVAAGMVIRGWTGSEAEPERRVADAPVAAREATAAGEATLPAPQPTRVVTPPGGASRLAIGDAVVSVGGDAELSLESAADGAVTVRLVRGLVDCEVAPRAGRAPFAVVAGDVTVSVVGTRFSVERPPAGPVRVEVTRGRVAVAGPAGGVQLAAGQAWDARAGILVARAPAAPSATNVPQAGALADAVALEASDPDAAAAHYAALAAAASAAAPADPAAAEEAAYRLARLELRRARWDAALAAARAYEAAYARGAHLEEVLWFRVEASCGAYRSRAAEAAARAYLARFPQGTHAAAARSRAVCAGR